VAALQRADQREALLQGRHFLIPLRSPMAQLRGTSL